ncbi:hypothetical protein AXG93_725s1410 [Marchantia polymorpha subsp. ruderalis]|uniref:UDP-N-acetylmuramate dehydrogenase n=1 Tax=Marchantia polymorpha subsp. ruderalis TaxID=1480154 RepID=A0A176WFR9_MARPO|nr:hypothetical protein AXG93_725s1410 [Marchantia polymorpha subsp. ruderalis]
MYVSNPMMAIIGCQVQSTCGILVGGKGSHLSLENCSRNSGLQRWEKFRRCTVGLRVRGGVSSDGQLESLPSFERGKRLSELSTLGIGGPAKYFVEVHDESQMSTAIRGFDGCVILNSLKFLERQGRGVYRVGSGYPFNTLGIQTSKDGFTGLEFASGIPGTVGGAIFMNASANGQETANALKSVEVLCADGERIVHTKGQSDLVVYGYRLSPYQTMPGFMAILAATFELEPCLDARQRHKSLLERRRKTQPVAAKSAGCIFRNPGTGSQSAGALIEQAGLKGIEVGRAKVSNIHANFLLNAGGSSAADMITLIELVKEQVKRKLGVDLREEVIYVPYS